MKDNRQFNKIDTSIKQCMIHKCDLPIVLCSESIIDCI